MGILKQNTNYCQSDDCTCTDVGIGTTSDNNLTSSNESTICCSTSNSCSYCSEPTVTASPSPSTCTSVGIGSSSNNSYNACDACGCSNAILDRRIRRRRRGR